MAARQAGVLFDQVVKAQADLKIEFKIKTNPCFPQYRGTDAVMVIAIDRMVLSDVDIKMKTVEQEQVFYAAKYTGAMT